MQKCCIVPLMANAVQTLRSLSPGTYYTSISWLVDGDYVETNLRPNMDLDLIVQNSSGSVSAGSVSASDSQEIVKFTITSTQNITFRIERYWNSGVGDVVLGMVIRAR